MTGLVVVVNVLKHKIDGCGQCGKNDGFSGFDECSK